MNIDLVEFLYSISGIAAFALAIFLLWRRDENFRSDTIFTDPESLSNSQLLSFISYSQAVMKNNPAGSEKHIDAAQRLGACEAEKARRYRILEPHDTAAK